MGRRKCYLNNIDSSIRCIVQKGLGELNGDGEYCSNGEKRMHNSKIKQNQDLQRHSSGKFLNTLKKREKSVNNYGVKTKKQHTSYHSSNALSTLESKFFGL